MRWGFPAAAAALFLLSPVQLFAQSRSAVMTVSVTVVRSGGSAGAVSTSTPGNTAPAVIPGSAERPLPAPPRATETEVVIPTPSSIEASSSSVMMVTINY